MRTQTEDIIVLRCITTKAMNTNNVFIFAFSALRQGFLRYRYNVSKANPYAYERNQLVIHHLHELSLRYPSSKKTATGSNLQRCIAHSNPNNHMLAGHTFNLTLHSKGNNNTLPFEVLLGFCKLLQAAVSKPILHSTHTCSTNAKASHRNSTDLFCLFFSHNRLHGAEGRATFTTCESCPHSGEGSEWLHNPYLFMSPYSGET